MQLLLNFSILPFWLYILPGCILTCEFLEALLYSLYFFFLGFILEMMDKKWMSYDIHSDEYRRGVEFFIAYLHLKYEADMRLSCPCRNCLNDHLYTVDVIRAHLLVDGIDVTYQCWIYHGEELSIRLPVIT